MCFQNGDGRHVRAVREVCAWVQVESQSSLALIIPGYGACADEDQVTKLLGEHGGFLGTPISTDTLFMPSAWVPRPPAPGLLC